MVSAPEAKALAQEWVDRLEAAPWDEAERYVHAHEEEVVLASGTTYRSKAYAFWDAEPRKSSLIVGAHVYPQRGWRQRRGYRAFGAKDEDDLPDEWPLPL